MPLRKPRLNSPCRYPDGTAIDAGHFVRTVNQEYEGRWWFRWPGKVVGKEGENAIVEWLGWGNVVTRRRAIPGKHLEPIVDDELTVRLYLVSRYLNRSKKGAEDDNAPRIKLPAPQGHREEENDDERKDDDEDDADG